MPHYDDHHRVHPKTAVLTRGFEPSLSVGSARPAVFRSSTYVFSSPESAERAFAIAQGKAKPAEGENVELIYSRISHPNAEILEDQVVPLEAGAREAAVFNSGMAAIMTAFTVFTRPGGTLVYTVPCYGGTSGLIHNFLEPWGVKVVAVPAHDRAATEEAIRGADNLAVVFLETPANPTLRMIDLRRICEVAAHHPSRPTTLVDNTFMGPSFQHPLLLGAHVVLYSATKYLSGFSDIVAGVALAKEAELIDRLRSARIMFGNILQPDECWILDGRLPTVPLRMSRQTQNAELIAEALSRHTRVLRVIYPSLFEDAEQARIFREQCDHAGAILALDFAGGRDTAFTFLRHLRIARNAVSLGGVETLACHPRTTTHSGMSCEELDAAGITPGLVRISVGIEDWRDLLADFEQALDMIE